MKIARVESTSGEIEFCVFDEEKGKYFAIVGNIYGNFGLTDQQVDVAKLLTPVTPSKIVAIGVNYAEHAAEMNRELIGVPAVFFKPTTSLLAPDGQIVYPAIASLVHYEAELAIVIGKKCRNVSKEEADQYIFGYTCANDVTERKIQKSDIQWTRGKGFDTFCPVGPYIETEIDPRSLELKAIRNGQTVQLGNTADLIFDCCALVEFVSGFTTLLEGDVILTGTPKGVGELKVGDQITVEIEGIGSLTNTVVSEKAE